MEEKERLTDPIDILRDAVITLATAKGLEVHSPVPGWLYAGDIGTELELDASFTNTLAGLDPSMRIYWASSATGARSMFSINPQVARVVTNRGGLRQLKEIASLLGDNPLGCYIEEVVELMTSEKIKPSSKGKVIDFFLDGASKEMIAHFRPPKWLRVEEGKEELKSGG